LDRNAGAHAVNLLVNCIEIVYASQLVDILHTIISSISKKYFYFVGLQTECQISVEEHATGIQISCVLPSAALDLGEIFRYSLTRTACLVDDVGALDVAD
jgi:hypothetical protein